MIKEVLEDYKKQTEGKYRFVYGQDFGTMLKKRKKRLLLAGAMFLPELGLSIIFGLSAGEGLAFALLTTGIMIFTAEWEITEKAKRKKRRLRLMLAEVLERIAVLTDAGVPLWTAIVSVGENMEDDGALGSELRHTINSFRGENGYFYAPERAFEDMAERCRDSSVSAFVSLILQNSRKGEDELAVILRVQAANHRNERKNIAKQMADEATTLMLVPQVMILAAILVFVGAPAIIGYFI